MKFEEDFYPVEFMLTTPGYVYPSGYYYCGKCGRYYFSEEVKVCPCCGRKTEFVMLIH